MSKENKDLPDFLAERALMEGASIAYVSSGNLHWVEIDHQESGETEILLQLTAEELKISRSSIEKLLTMGEITLPVLREQEEAELLSVLKEMKLSGVRIYRLSTTERFLYHRQKPETKNKVV